MRNTVLVLALMATTACGDEGGQASTEAAEARKLASRSFCAATELLGQAQEQQQMLSGAGVSGATVFADAFLQHAELRYAALAQTDSALNFSRAAADSARHAEAASRFEIRSPEPGSVEANVFSSYEQRLARILNDPDHPCNWKQELER